MKFKKIFYSLIFCITACYSHAQAQETDQKNYFIKGSNWTEFTINILDGSNKHLYTTKHFLGNDTLINNLSYKKLYAIIDEKADYWGALREEKGKVYAILLYYGENSSEFMLYDFTLQKGDHFISNAKDGVLSDPEGILVTKIDTIQLLNGESRKRFYFDQTEPWIEGVGSLRGIDHDAMSHPTNGRVKSVVCYRENNLELYKDTYWGSIYNNCCDLSTDLPQYDDKNYSNKIVHDQLDIYLKEEALNGLIFLSIHNIEGKTLSNKQMKGTKHLIVDFSSYKPGVYIVNVDALGAHYNYKIIKY